MTTLTPVRAGVSLEALLAAKDSRARVRLTGSLTINNLLFR